MTKVRSLLLAIVASAALAACGEAPTSPLAASAPSAAVQLEIPTLVETDSVTVPESTTTSTTDPFDTTTCYGYVIAGGWVPPECQKDGF